MHCKVASRLIVSGVLIRNQETGLVLPSAPEFARDGSWPPVVTEWLPLRWELFEADPHNLDTLMAYLLFTLRRSRDPLLAEDTQSASLIYEPSFPDDASAVIKVTQTSTSVEIKFNDDSIEIKRKRWRPTAQLYYMSEAALRASGGDPIDLAELHQVVNLLNIPYKELRRLVHYARWRRKDPITQLPPGSTQEMMHSVTTGLSVERSQALAGSLGLNLGVDMTGVQAKLSSQLQQELGFKLDITAQEEMSTKLTLTNQSNDHYRLFALWHIDHLITVDALSVPTTRHRGHSGFTSGLQPSWTRLGSEEFVTSNEPFVTFAEIDRS
jgi:hypothetical protein